MGSSVSLSIGMNSHRHHSRVFGMHRPLKNSSQKFEGMQLRPATGRGVQSLQIFDLDRPSSLFVYLREIGKLFPLPVGSMRGQKHQKLVPHGAGKGRQIC